MLGVIVLLDISSKLDILLYMVKFMKICARTHFLLFFVQFEMFDGRRIKCRLESRIRDRFDDWADEHLALAGLGSCFRYMIYS